MNDRDFHNYQRVLSGYPPVSFTLLGFHLTATIAGLAGLFTLMQSQMLFPQKAFWVSALAVLLAFVTLMLWLMWFREHKLKDQAVKDLRNEGIRFPVTLAWTGVVTIMHGLFYLFGFVLWVSLAAIGFANPQYLLSKFGL
jgi:hypothetical protein